MTAEIICKDWVEPAMIPDAKHYDAVYDDARKIYWIKNARGGWIEITETSLRRCLKEARFSSKPFPGEALSELDQKILYIQRNCDVAYAGPLAGHSIGMVEILGNRILVTSSPELIQPLEGDWPTIFALLENLFDDPKQDQRPYVYGWLKVTDETLRAGAYRPGQALTLAGPRDSGKSLLQGLITVILGGRAAKPYRYMSGGSQFNSELIGVEHLMMEDDTASNDIRTRRDFGARIKEVTVNRVQSCHAKNRQAISLTPVWRLTISLNEEPENLLILPPIDESLADKIMLFKTRKKPMPMRTVTLAEQELYWAKLISELPAFLYFLSKWEIPPELRSERFGVKHYHHPELLEAMDALSPETRLLSLIDQIFWSVSDPEARIKVTPPKSLLLTAEQLEKALLESAFSYEAKRLFTYSNAAGTYLGRLATKHPARVQCNRTANSRNWVINPPSP